MIKEHKSIKQKEIIDLINVGVDGLINNGIYKRYSKLLKAEKAAKKQSLAQQLS